MISAEVYQSGRPVVVLERANGSDAGPWARLQTALARGIVGGSINRLDVRVDVFLAELNVVREVRNLFKLELQIGPALQAQLRALAGDRRARESFDEVAADINLELIAKNLKAAGFRRALKDFQLENLAQLLALPHGADFSVPGAGKTTVALAGYVIRRSLGTVQRLVVIGPIACFQSWKDDAEACLSEPPRIVVHGGPETLIPDATELLLTNYNRVAADYDRIRAFIAEKPTQVILDEAHRIKRGADGVHGRAALDLSFAAARRDVLTGTPAPQGAFDLIALVQFLYPGQDRQILPNAAYSESDGREPIVLEETSRAISRFFVRTPKSRLQLPPTEFEVVVKPMGAIQQAIYDALLGRYRGNFRLATQSRREFDRLGRVLMYLLEAATNPMLLVAGSDTGDSSVLRHPPLELVGDEPLSHLLARYGDFETPWKYLRIASIISAAVSNGHKVLVWSSFVRNLKALARLLAPYNPAVVHGGVPPEDGASVGSITRESELQKFRHDESCSVLLANPAACGEGVSLHHWCHHAVYIDRTFNAGQFLQSQDRIHRLGLQENTLTRFTLLLSNGTIDQTVDWRLREKVTALARLMNDKSLVRLALPEPDESVTASPLFGDDMRAIAAHIGIPVRGAS